MYLEEDIYKRFHKQWKDKGISNKEVLQRLQLHYGKQNFRLSYENLNKKISEMKYGKGLNKDAGLLFSIVKVMGWSLDKIIYGSENAIINDKLDLMLSTLMDRDYKKITKSKSKIEKTNNIKSNVRNEIENFGSILSNIFYHESTKDEKLPFNEQLSSFILLYYLFQVFESDKKTEKYTRNFLQNIFLSEEGSKYHDFNINEILSEIVLFSYHQHTGDVQKTDIHEMNISSNIHQGYMMNPFSSNLLEFNFNDSKSKYNFLRIINWSNDSNKINIIFKEKNESCKDLQKYIMEDNLISQLYTIIGFYLVDNNKSNESKHHFILGNDMSLEFELFKSLLSLNILIRKVIIIPNDINPSKLKKINEYIIIISKITKKSIKHFETSNRTHGLPLFDKNLLYDFIEDLTVFQMYIVKQLFLNNNYNNNYSKYKQRLEQGLLINKVSFIQNTKLNLDFESLNDEGDHGNKAFQRLLSIHKSSQFYIQYLF
ncbi:MAG: hypothetical protein B6226_00730 [Candidatus Cloacimonetes bacterium 4572_65]|nr:MAG: hypothetical protein B6226_00730 [Candidatus Cloacimonetes bacterium 4572_65]